MSGFAYFDKYGILHVTESESVAKRIGKGKYVEVQIPYGDGYPKTTEGENIVVYDYGKKIRIGNRKNERGRVIKPEHVPHLIPIIEQLNE